MVSAHEDTQFEELLRLFDAAVASLESDSLSLEEALSKYEEAVKLADRCGRLLKSAELRITEIDSMVEQLDDAPEA